jgi:hypothetical protein
MDNHAVVPCHRGVSLPVGQVALGYMREGACRGRRHEGEIGCTAPREIDSLITFFEAGRRSRQVGGIDPTNHNKRNSVV